MIAIDTTFFGHDEIKNRKLSLSTSIFTADILDAFVELGVSDEFCLLANFNHADFFKERFPKYKIISIKWFPVSFLYKITSGKKTATKLFKKFGILKRVLEKNKFSAVWFPYAMNQTFVKTKLKTFATIHDIYRIHNGTQKEKAAFEKFILDSDIKLICVSSYTKNDIIKTTNCTKEIDVIPNSIVFDVSKKSPVKQLENKNFILDLNAYIYKKNPMTLLKAFNLIKDKTNLSLVFCGGYKEEKCYSEMENFIKHNNMQDKVYLLFRVSDEERNWLLKHTSLFVTTSLFEGFGRTPVEAAICKIPVISTKETSLFEATMGLVNYVENPNDEVELSKLILEKLHNPDTKEKLENIAETLQNNYLPENCAEKYLKIFDIPKIGGGYKLTLKFVINCPSSIRRAA